VIVAAVIGCGKGDSGGTAGPKLTERAAEKVAVESKSDETTTAKATKPWDPAAGTASINGLVKYLGKAPKRRPIDMGGKPECAAHKSDQVLDESIIVGADGAMKNVFVYVRKGVEEWSFPVPTEAVELSQKGCMFHPHVVGVRVGQPVKVKNDDTFAHNVRSTPTSLRNAAFNFMQATGGKEDIVKFQARDVMVRIGCDLHGWMRANIGVVDNPFFAITGDDGKFSLKGLPKGEYTIEAVHEELGRHTQTVRVGDKETKEITFEFSKK
jgi:plastocyanin